MRRSLRFVPNSWDSLEIRLALSHATAIAPGHGEIRIAVPRGFRPQAAPRLKPVAVFNQELDSFRSDVLGAAMVAAQGRSTNASDGPSSQATPPQGSDNPAAAGANYSSFVSTRAQIMALNLQNLTTNFSTSPAKRPGSAKPPGNRSPLPRYSPQSGAAGSSANLAAAVLAIPLPSQPGPEVTRYNAIVDQAIEAFRTDAIGEVRSLSLGIPTPPRRRPPSPPSVGR
ncbi:hypothetical protein V5E97_09235 [Singulisphaera sp. Ch08]|uniref:Uncharacterized protein n=1 Tax=Singulisphaera sp. Ch08 TaxID=3120278 RepID=A0AAU7CME0_9BACT